MNRQHPEDLYTDGGVIGRNPSPHGGTVAFCVVRGEERLCHAQGVITPHEAQLPAVTNNLTELLAAVMALETMPDGWDGVLHTDSQVTKYRLEGSPKLNGIPDWLRDRLAAALARMGEFSVRLLGGHPTKMELAAGQRWDGLPCSPHNVFCDKLCGIEAKAFLKRLAEVAA